MGIKNRLHRAVRIKWVNIHDVLRIGPITMRCLLVEKLRLALRSQLTPGPVPVVQGELLLGEVSKQMETPPLLN